MVFRIVFVVNLVHLSNLVHTLMLFMLFPHMLVQKCSLNSFFTNAAFDFGYVVSTQMITHVKYDFVTKLALGLGAVIQHVFFKIIFIITPKITLFAFEWKEFQMDPLQMLLDHRFLVARPGT